MNINIKIVDFSKFFCVGPWLSIPFLEHVCEEPMTLNVSLEDPGLKYYSQSLLLKFPGIPNI